VQRRPTTRPGTVISVLGRFDVRHEHQPLDVPAGLPATGVKYVAVHGGRVRTEALIEALWPDAGIDEGRKGVRNLLSRLARGGTPLLQRDGDTIRVPRETHIDAVAFQVIADRVLFNVRHPGATEGARLALDHYAGDLLPDDVSLEWADPFREKLRRRRLALIDLLASDARRRGAKREAVVLMEMAIEAEPYDDIRYLEVAEMLMEAGRRGRAAVYVHRSLQVLREYGLQPGRDWEVLYRQLQTAPETGPDAPARQPDGPAPAAPEAGPAGYQPSFDPEARPPAPLPGPAAAPRPSRSTP
jgi:DNA-binding SARP family transcriptional activator